MDFYIVYNEVDKLFKKIIHFVKKIIFSALVLYGYNLIIAPLGAIIPINIITVLTIAFLGIPSLFSFIILSIFVY